MTPNTILQRPRSHATLAALVLYATLAAPGRAHASLLHGETLDTAADVLSWIIIFLVPIIGVAVFWLVHILPEKVAEKRKHPQSKAIQCLCLLSLVFGGLLWPIAWLWAYSKPVLHKLAYGTDVDESIGHKSKSEAKQDSSNESGKPKEKGGQS